MGPMKRFPWGLALALLLAAMLVAQTAAEAGGYRLDWFTFDAGGAVSAGASGYTLSGTIGQPEAGSSTSGGYTLSGGFWPGGAAPVDPPSTNYEIYLPLLER